MINVFIADDHAIVRRGLRQLLEQQPDMCVVGEAADGRAVLLAPNRDIWDMLILDLSLPKVSGIEVLRRLREDLPRLRIVVLSMYPEDQYGLRLIREGAAAYISKDLDVTELLRALRAVAVGGSYLSETLTEKMRHQSMHGSARAHDQLSAREHQVFTLLIQGSTVTEIASELNLSVSTVSNHASKIKEKLGARTIGDVVGYAHRMGLLGPT